MRCEHKQRQQQQKNEVFQQTIMLISFHHVTLLVQSGKLLLIHIPEVLYGLPTAKIKLHKATTTIQFHAIR